MYLRFCFHDSLLSITIPRYLYVSTFSTVSPLITTSLYTGTFLLKSITISFVFPTFSCKLILITPVNKSVYLLSVTGVVIICYLSSKSSVIGKLGYWVWFVDIFTICRIQREKEERKLRSLRCSCVFTDGPGCYRRNKFTYWGPLVKLSSTHKMVGALIFIFKSFSANKCGCIVLKALEKSKNMRRM